MQDELFLLILDRVKPLAWSFARSTGLDPDDLLQEIAAHLVRKQALVLAVENPVAYGIQLARNVLIDQYRKVARRRRIAPMISLEAPLSNGEYCLLDVLPA